MLDYCDTITQSYPSARARQSSSALPTLSRCLQGPPGSLPALQRRVLKIHFSSGEQTFGLECESLPLSSALESQTPGRLGVLLGSKGQRTVVPFCRHRDTFVCGGGEEAGGGGGNFLHCGSGQLYFIQQAPRPPQTTRSQAALRGE